MFRNYLKSSLRNLQRDGLITGINVFGLSAGFAASLLIFLFVKGELEYDKLKDADNIYRVEFQQKSDQSPKWPVVPHDWTRKYAPQMPGIVDYTLIRRMSSISTIEVGDRAFSERDVIISNPGIIDMFDLELIGPTLSEPLEGRKKVILSEPLAATYFKGEDAVGQMITINGEDGFLVTAVYKKTVPVHMTFELIMSVDETIERGPFYWLFTYLKLRPGADPDQIVDKVNVIADEFSDPFYNDAEFKVEPMTGIYFGANADLQILRYGNLSTVYIFVAIGLMILITASLNFVNLTIATFEKRTKEVGVRKVLGSSKKQVVMRFLSESWIVVFGASLLGVFLVALAIPMVNDSLNIRLEFSMFSEPLALGLMLLFGAMASFASFYPSFFPHVLTTTRSTKRKSNSIFKNLTVLFQFGVSMLLIIGMLLVNDQLKFMKNKDLGLGEDKVLMIKVLDPALNPKVKDFAKRFENHPGVVSTAALMGSPGSPQLAGFQNVWAEGMPQGESLFMSFYAGDDNAIETFGMELLEGQDFSTGINVPEGTLATVVNESAVREFGWEDPIGKRMAISGDPAVVVGVVKDFHFASLQNRIAPTAIVYDYNLYLIGVRIRSEALSATMDFVEKQWNEIEPNKAMESFFMKDSFNKQYAHEEKLEVILRSLTFLALVISAVGTLGIMMLMIRQRTKEIGIRKVLGAGVGQLLILLNKQVFVLLLTGNLIVWPLAFYLANNWLDSFAYRTSLNLFSFVLAALITAAVAFGAFGFHAIRAASLNPVDTLRDE